MNGVSEPATGWLSLLTLASDEAMGTVAGEEAPLNNERRITIADHRMKIVKRTEMPQLRKDRGRMMKEPSI
jgi:hypothetical protein